MAEPVFVPYMGAHWVNSSGGKFAQPGSFTKTFIYGSYDASFIFYEPMITVAHLKEKTPSINEFPPLGAYDKPAYYPSSYSIAFDEKRKEYVISLQGMEWRD